MTIRTLSAFGSLSKQRIIGFIDECGGTEEAIRAIVSLGRALWIIASRPDEHKSRVIASQTGPLLSILASLVEHKFIAEITGFKVRQCGPPAGTQAAVRESRTRFQKLIKLLLQTGYAKLPDGFDAPPQADGEDQADANVRKLLDADAENELHLSLEVLHPSRLCVHTLALAVGLPVVSYCLRKNKREYYGVSLGPEVARVFHLCSAEMNSRMPGRQEEGGIIVPGLVSLMEQPDLRKEARRALGKKGRATTVWQYASIQDALEAALRDARIDWTRRPEIAVRLMSRLFVEACLMVGYLGVDNRSKPNERGIDVIVKCLRFDAEFLLSNLFGLPSGIDGLDTLFGGGGPLLAEGLETDRAKPQRQVGRIILIRGPSGIGKTILAMQLSLGVAEKGGVAWYVPLEQPIAECVYSMQSALSQVIGSVRMRSGNVASAEALDEAGGWVGFAAGALAKESLELFLAGLEAKAKELAAHSLRLLVVDPINSVFIEAGVQQGEIRAEFVRTIRRIKTLGANIIFVGEEVETFSGLGFIESVCDTVIRLSVEVNCGYSHKLIEIRKSRLQREQRGRHEFSIQPGRGVRILPSVAAVASLMRNRLGAPLSPKPLHTGCKDLDVKLGKSPFYRGDAIVVYGESAILKNAIATLFGRGCDWPVGAYLHNLAVTLVIAFGKDDDAVEKQLRIGGYDAGTERYQPAKMLVETHVLGFPPGFTSAGAVLQHIADRFEHIRRKGLFVDRVVVEGLDIIDTAFVLLASDRAFSGVLVEMLRKYRVTTMYLCSAHAAENRTSAECIIFSLADCVLDIGRGSPEGSLSEAVVRRVRRYEFEEGETGMSPFLLGYSNQSGFTIKEVPCVGARTAAGGEETSSTERRAGESGGAPFGQPGTREA